jgi:hypothetical protein
MTDMDKVHEGIIQAAERDESLPEVDLDAISREADRIYWNPMRLVSMRRKRKPLRQVLREYWLDSVRRVNPEVKPVREPDPHPYYRSKWGRWDVLFDSMTTWDSADSQWAGTLLIGLGLGIFFIALVGW